MKTLGENKRMHSILVSYPLDLISSLTFLPSKRDRKERGRYGKREVCLVKVLTR